jgi:hypothetical protein
MDGQEFVAGAEVQETTEPAIQETEPVNPTAEATETAQAAPQAETEPTTDDANGKTEEDARFANIRRTAEEKANAKYAARQAKIDAEFQRLFGGAVNPLTGKPITSAEEYIAAYAEQKRRDDEEELKAAGITNERFAEMVRNLPEFKQAMENSARMQKAEEERYLGEALKEIQKLDPSVKTREDLEKHASYPEVYDLVMNHGITLEKAFRYANMEALSAKNSAAVKQAAVNQAKGKSHLVATGSGMSNTKELKEVPAATMAELTKFYPKLTEAELKAKYNEYE